MKFFKFIVFFYIILSLNIVAFAESTSYVWSNNSTTVETSNEIDSDNSL